MPTNPNPSPELTPYVALVRFLGEALGPDTEVVLQDCSDFEHSILAIANGNISGRAVGGPTTDLVLRIWQNREYEHKDYLVRYAGTTSDGRRLMSSTFFIRDSGGVVIGFLCINHDTSAQGRAKQAVQSLSRYFGTLDDSRSPAAETGGRLDAGIIGTADAASKRVIHEGTHQNGEDASSSSIESFPIRAEDLIVSYTTAFSNRHSLNIQQLSRAERVELIEELEQSGVFAMKGSVETVAETLGISLPTVYRDLQHVRAGSA